jgi:hypothetical protein
MNFFGRSGILPRRCSSVIDFGSKLGQCQHRARQEDEAAAARPFSMNPNEPAAPLGHCTSRPHARAVLLRQPPLGEAVAMVLLHGMTFMSASP